MTLKEIYHFKRESFIDQTTKHFKYLVDDFGYCEPEYRFSKQDNGTIILDEFRYENKGIDRAMSITNAYHPVDYGFEISFYRPSISLVHTRRKMVVSILKEERDIKQTYIEPLAEKFKKDFLDIITGEIWID